MAVRPWWRRQAGRRPRGDDVAWCEPDVLGEVLEDLGYRVAHRARPAVLDRLAVDRAAEADVGRVELVGRDDHWAGWAEPGHRLAEQPLVAIKPCVARRDV